MLATTAAMIEQFNKDNIELLLSMGYEVHMFGNFDKGNPISKERLDAFKIWLEERGCRYFNSTATRSPFDLKNNIKAYQETVKLIEKWQYDFIHCHTPIGSVIARLAGKRTGTRVIYTAHGFHFYKGAPIKNWLLYYPVEKALSSWTDVLITITKEDYQRAKAHMYAGKTAYVPGIGVKAQEFSSFSKKEREEFRGRLGLSHGDLAILTAGELNQNKNQQLVFRAIAAIKEPHVHYFLCGIGDKEEELKTLAKELGIADQVHILGFRDDMKEIYAAVDIYCCSSLREGLSVAIMEAMSAGLPCLVSKIRGNTDLVQEGENGYLFESNNVEELTKKLRLLLEDPKTRAKMRDGNKEIIQAFESKAIRKRMSRIYGGM